MDPAVFLRPILLADAIHQMWYAVPLVLVVSLVYAATRHEFPRPILIHAARFAGWITIFMAIVLVVLEAMSRFV